MSESVGARFWVQKITRQAVTAGNVQTHVELAPVIRSTGQPGDGQNTDWSKYTPSGKIELSITTEGASTWFEERLGQDIAIQFSDPA